MAKLRAHGLTVSVDGYMAGPNQTLETPMGVGTQDLHKWMIQSRYGQEMFGMPVTAEPSIDDDFARVGFENIGANVMGRNMFGPIRGEWTAEEWKGWWGDNPPYHSDTFVLTHYPHDPIPMEGGTTFYFVTDGLESAVQQAFAAADGKDVRLNGGASTVRQGLEAKLVDEMHIAISPILLGGGESLLGGLDLPSLGYEVTSSVSSAHATHVSIAKK